MKKDIYWGYTAQILQYGSTLIILPIILKKLNTVELGVWYVFMTISTLISMLDMGFTPSITRNISYAMAGADNLQQYGCEKIKSKGSANYSLILAIIKSSNFIFNCTSAFGFVLLATAGTFYILHITHNLNNTHQILIAWVVFCIASTLNLFNKRYLPIIQGRGLFSRFYKCTTVSNLLFLATATTLLLLNNKLTGISFAYLISSLTSFLIFNISAYDNFFKKKLSISNKNTPNNKDVFKTIWPTSWRLGAVIIGSFFILRANTLLISTFLGLEITASYGLTLQIFTVIQSASTVYFNIQQQKITKLRIENSDNLLSKAIETTICASLLIYIIGVSVFVFFGNTAISIINHKTQLLPFPALALMALINILELNHSLAAGIISTSNEVPFVKSAIFSGLSIFFISMVGLKFGNGIYWILFTQMLVQMSYNNWKWPFLLSFSLKTSYARILTSGTKEIIQIVKNSITRLK